MALLTSMEDLVHAIAGSIMHAQHQVEKVQVANITSFFNEKNQPNCINIQLPAIHSTAKENEMFNYSLPLVSLVPHSSLIIGEAEIDLDVELGGYEELPTNNLNQHMVDQSGMNDDLSSKSSLMFNLSNGGLAKNQGNSAHIKLKLVATDKSEGLARLVNDVIKAQGYSGPSEQ